MNSIIPKELVYFGAGVVADKVVQSVFGTSLSDVVNELLYKFSERQRLKEIELRRVVDVMGDTVGYLNDDGNIKRWIE